MKYIIGLDVGIGSVGWAVVRNEDDCKRIEDFGVRIFDSSEDVKNRKSEAQKRREARGRRRLIRRRSYRKNALKYYLQKTGITTLEAIENYYKDNSHNIIDLRVKALDEKVSAEELTACLIHIANHRGYTPFYEVDENDKKSDEGQNLSAMNKTDALILNGEYRSVAEAIKKDSYFKEESTNRNKYRNTNEKKEILFSSKMLKKEVLDILKVQSEYYSQLTEESIEKIMDIIFSRRDFEDGPGNPTDIHRPYKGFKDSIGNCPFYTDEKRGCRFTVVGDVYALINKLSQYKYVDKSTGEVQKVPDKLMSKVIKFALVNGKIGKKDINRIAKETNIELLNPDTGKSENIADCFKYMKIVKPIFEEYGFDWEKLISGDYLSENTLVNRIGRIISYNVTPARRIKELEKIPEITYNKELIKKLAKQSFSGTSQVSDKYMIDAINAFKSGVLYGEFQAQIIKDKALKVKKTEKYDKLPPFDSDCEYAQNPVVFRSINETRKIVNAIIDRYGTPYALNIEVAKDLNSSFETRSKITKAQNDNEKARKNSVTAIAEILGIPEEEVRQKHIERYTLGELQGWRCLYSGKEIKEIKDKKEAILNINKKYEVDHIVPFSLILDNTLNNKALVIDRENQNKGQRTPLMYLSEDRKKAFKANVNKLFKSKKINKTKYNYLMLDSLTSDDARKLLDDWKTRNLNDTRYISKFLVKYFKENLKFSQEKSEEKRPDVYAVKGAITSSLRKQWLNKNTWGQSEKADLKKITFFDHAVDAIVIANCLPAYVEIAVENRKLREIYYSANKKITDEYERSLNNCVGTLLKFYGMSPLVSRKLLGKLDSTPSLIKDLRHEVEYRVRDYELMRYFIKGCENADEEQLDEIFRNDLLKVYSDDVDFANSIEMPIISIKPQRKYRGKITSDTIAKKSELSSKHSVKKISENNSSVIEDGFYYCVEVYKTQKDETSLQGIKRNDIVKKNGRLYLKPDYQYPDDYKEHIMYLFYGDFLEIQKRNEIRRGFYFSVKNMNRNQIYISKGNSKKQIKNHKEAETCGIAKKDIIRKYNIDILGKKGGLIKCGEPLSLLPEKN